MITCNYAPTLSAVSYGDEGQVVLCTHLISHVIWWGWWGVQLSSALPPLVCIVKQNFKLLKAQLSISISIKLELNLLKPGSWMVGPEENDQKWLTGIWQKWIFSLVLQVCSVKVQGLSNQSKRVKYSILQYYLHHESHQLFFWQFLGQFPEILCRDVALVVLVQGTEGQLCPSHHVSLENGRFFVSHWMFNLFKVLFPLFLSV